MSGPDLSSLLRRRQEHLITKGSRYHIAAVDATGDLNIWNAASGGDIYALAVSGTRLAACGSYWNIGSETGSGVSMLFK